MASSVERARSVSSMRSRNLPPRPRAYSQLNRAVRAPPICRKPVGEGAKRVTTVSVMSLGREIHRAAAFGALLYHGTTIGCSVTFGPHARGRVGGAGRRVMSERRGARGQT